jgi:hypothetical protein
MWQNIMFANFYSQGGRSVLTLSDFQEIIDQQLFHNQNKSLFYELANGQLVLNASKGATELLQCRAKEMSNFIQHAYLYGTYIRIMEGISSKTIKLFMEANQYLNFSREDYHKLQKVYSEIFKRVCILANQNEISEREIDNLFTSHYKNLRTFLLETNGTEIFKKYRDNPDLFQIKCAEYTPEFQMQLLKVNCKMIKQPILDLGCGQQASLVHFLRQNGIEAYGMDRNLIDTTNFLFEMNWLECAFTSNTWGTVISHMAFSNHFAHHHIKADGNFDTYARKYMEILNSLKIGGSFIYAPRLSFIEQLLIQSKSFIIETREHSTTVLRIK